jgi:hypothetical protein
VRVKRVVLEDHRDVAVLRRQVVDLAPADQDLAPGDFPPARSISAAASTCRSGRPDQYDELLVANVDGHAVQELGRANAL